MRMKVEKQGHGRTQDTGMINTYAYIRILNVGIGPLAENHLNTAS